MPERTRLIVLRRPGESVQFDTEHGPVLVKNNSEHEVSLCIEAPEEVRYYWPGRRGRPKKPAQTA